MITRERRLVVVIVLMLANTLTRLLVPDSVVRGPIQWLFMAALITHLALSVRSGYLRHRGKWTRESWRRYLTACAIPVFSLVLLFALLFAMDARWPIFGVSRSTLRAVWAGALLLLMIIGGIGLIMVVERLDRGDPDRQFEWPLWLRRGASR